MIKCKLTGKEQHEQYTTRLTSGERIDIDTHHLIMMEEKNYFFDLNTAKKHYALILEESKLANTILQVLRNKYKTIEAISQKLNEYKKLLNTESVKIQGKEWDSLERDEVKAGLLRLQTLLKDELGDSYDPVNRGSGAQTFYKRVLNKFIPQHEIIF